MPLGSRRCLPTGTSSLSTGDATPTTISCLPFLRSASVMSTLNASYAPVCWASLVPFTQTVAA